MGDRRLAPERGAEDRDKDGRHGPPRSALCSEQCSLRRIAREIVVANGDGNRAVVARGAVIPATARLAKR